MKANELRIGNLLYCAERDIPYQITAEDILVIDDGSSKSRPIPLTEEWLIDFGFEKNNKNKNRFIHYISGFEIERQGSKFAYAVWGEEDAPFLTQFFGHHNYIHQLQNLYFALTGEELTVKV